MFATQSPGRRESPNSGRCDNHGWNEKSHGQSDVMAVLRQGVDTSVAITDADSIAAAEYLQSQSVDASPCGAGSFAGFRTVAENAPAGFHLKPDSVVAIVSTDGRRRSQYGG